MAVDANGNWIDPNLAYDETDWLDLDDSSQANLTTNPSTWLAKITSDMRSAFSEIRKLGINPVALLSGNVSLRSLLTNAFGIAAGAARDAALADAKNTIHNDLDRYKGMNIASGSSPFCVIGELHGMNTNVNTSGTTSMSQLPIYSSTSGFEYRFDTTKLFIDNLKKMVLV